MYWYKVSLIFIFQIMFKMPLLSFLTVTCRVGSVIPKKFLNSATFCQKYQIPGKDFKVGKLCKVPSNPLFSFCTRSFSGTNIWALCIVLYQLMLFIRLSFSVNSTMRYEGIQSFYDFRNYPTEQLNKDAQRLIDVSHLFFDC